MGRTKEIVLIPIGETRCGKCAKLKIFQDHYVCPKNRILPRTLPPFFGEACNLFEEKEPIPI